MNYLEKFGTLRKLTLYFDLSLDHPWINYAHLRDDLQIEGERARCFESIY